MMRERMKELLPVIQAYSEGKKIQRRDTSCVPSEWQDTDNIDFNISYIKYRVKPEPKYRPYENVEEFLKSQKEHGPYIGTCVFNADQKIQLWIPTAIFSSPLRIRVNGRTLESNRIFSDYKWQDGTPCGISEDDEIEIDTSLKISDKLIGLSIGT